MKQLFILILGSILFFSSCKTEKKQEQETLKSKIVFNQEQFYKFLEVDDNLKMAYLDMGNINNPLVILLHGEPNSSFVYRNIAPFIAKQGFRVIIPDLIGFGFSDKPEKSDVITYSNHTKWLNNFIEKLELKDINLFAHDWGAMISLRIIAEHPEKFKKVAISYGYLFEGTEHIPVSFKGFKNYAKNDPSFLAGNIMDWGSNTTLPDSIKLKYNEPFKTEIDFLAVRKFPSLVPTNNNDKEAILNQQLNKKLELFKKPFITIWGNHKDSMWIGKDVILQKSIPGAKNQTHYILDSNHFIQEDQPEELVQILLDFFKKKNKPLTKNVTN